MPVGVPVEPPPPPPLPTQATQENRARTAAVVVAMQKRRFLTADHATSTAETRSNMRIDSTSLKLPGRRTRSSQGNNMVWRMVVIVTVAVVAVVPFNATEAGEIEQLAAGGSPVQVKLTI